MCLMVRSMMFRLLLFCRLARKEDLVSCLQLAVGEARCHKKRYVIVKRLGRARAQVNRLAYQIANYMPPIVGGVPLVPLHAGRNVVSFIWCVMPFSFMFFSFLNQHSTFVAADAGPVMPECPAPVIAREEDLATEMEVAVQPSVGDAVSAASANLLRDSELTLHRAARRKIGSRWLPSVSTLEKVYLSYSSDPVGPGDVHGYDAQFDLLIPVVRILWADGSRSFEPLVNLRSSEQGVDRAIALMKSTDWRKYWGPLIGLLPRTVSDLNVEPLFAAGDENVGANLPASRVAISCDLIVPVIRCQWDCGSHWSYQPVMNLSHRVLSIEQAMARMVVKDWVTHWGSALTKVCDVFARL